MLVLTDGLSPVRDTVCRALLARGPPERLHAMAVTYNRSASEWIAHAEAALGGKPRSVRVVDTGGSGDRDPVVVDAAPDDLTGL